MTGILDLPPELIVEIFFEAGAAGQGLGPDSHNVYAMATTCKYLYAVFKEHESKIFSQVAQQILTYYVHLDCDHDFAIKLVARLVVARPPPSFPIHLFSGWLHDFLSEDALEQIKQADVSDMVEPWMYGGILYWMRRWLGVPTRRPMLFQLSQL